MKKLKNKRVFLAAAVAGLLAFLPLHVYAHSGSSESTQCSVCHTVSHQPASSASLAAPDFAVSFAVSLVSPALPGSDFLASAASRAPPAV